MKDEEMAKEKLSEEEYKLSEEVIKPIYYKAMKNDYSFAKYGVECYLAGLKAGRPQWHKVADGDLPKESGRYLVYVGGGENGVYPLDFDTEANDFGYWCLDVGDNLGVRDTIFETVTERNEDKVIAWCEIPTFDKE